MLQDARPGAPNSLQCSLDLQRSVTWVDVRPSDWQWQGCSFPFLERCKEHTVYHWDGQGFAPVARYQTSLIKLIPTIWGPPTFQIDGIKMLPSARESPYEDARKKVALIEPRGKVVLDCCAGLGYFAAWCIRNGASKILSFEKNADVIWLRENNPWSPSPDATLTLTHGDIFQEVLRLSDTSIDAVLHDPPRFSLAGELYSQAFYDQLARVMRKKARLFHYTGSPNRIARGRDLSNEVSRRLQISGFSSKKVGDGVLAVKD